MGKFRAVPHVPDECIGRRLQKKVMNKNYIKTNKKEKQFESVVSFVIT